MDVNLAWWLLVAWFTLLGVSFFAYLPYMGREKPAGKPTKAGEVNVILAITVAVMLCVARALGWV